MIIGQHRPHSNGDYLVAESGASRDVAVITGGNYGPGAVLGRVSATGALTAFDPTAADGSETAVAILFATAAAAAQPVKAAVTARAAEVNGLALAWRDGVTADQIAVAVDQLAALGIRARS